MWKLTIEDDEGQRTSLELVQQQYTVGRAEDASIRLTERNISRNHAVLNESDSGWTIEDGGSYNGTYVNGERVGDARPVGPGDVVHMGDYRIELMDAAAIEAEQQQQLAEQAQDTRQRRPDRLVTVIGPVPGVEYPLIGDVVTIGRAEEATVSINHASVSRIHTELHSLGDRRWEVVDQGSSNGIRINGVDLRRGIIEPGDALELGDVRLRFVAAGKYFRPAVDVSQQLPVVVPFEGMSPAGGVATTTRSSGSTGKIVGVAAVFLLLLIGGYVILSSPASSDPGPASTAAPMATTAEEARVLLSLAKDEDDIETAHKMLRRIPENSPIRESDDFKAIEDKWADFMFAQAEASDDNDAKRRLLDAIAESTSVSADKRQRALQLARELGPASTGNNGTPVPVPSGGGPLPTPSGSDTSPTTTNSATTSDPTTPPPPVPEPPTTSGGDDRFDEEAAKRRLYPKVAGGTATEVEVRMLRAICSRQGDTACRNMASSKLGAFKK